MGTPWTPKSARQAVETEPDPAKVVRELRRKRRPAAAAAAAEAPKYCSACWTALPPDATECTDCGTSVAEMLAAQAQREAADARWAPPRLLPAASGVDAEEDALGGADVEEQGVDAHPGTGALLPTDAEFPQRAPFTLARDRLQALKLPEGLRTHGWLVAQAAIVFALLFGAAESGKWLAYATSPSSTLDAGKVETTSPHTPARLHWKNPVPELRLDLKSSSGHVVASCNGRATDEVYRIRPGVYQLLVREQAGRWKGSRQQITAKPGCPILAGPSPVTLGAYYLWTGQRLLVQNEPRAARAALARAVDADPRNTEARRLLVRAAGRTK